jgi:hypothetical protein
MVHDLTLRMCTEDANVVSLHCRTCAVHVYSVTRCLVFLWLREELIASIYIVHGRQLVPWIGRPMHLARVIILAQHQD